MITRYGVWIDGQGLQDIDPAIYITDIIEEAPDEPFETAPLSGYEGSRITSRTRRSLMVTVHFAIREYDVMRRRGILQKVREWAQDGWLTTSEHQDQRLRVVCTGLPVISSALKWTEQLAVQFTAFALPYWQEIYPVTASGGGTSGTLYLRPMGTRPCRLEFTVTGKGVSATRIIVKANGKKLQFEGIAVTKDAPLVVEYTDDGILTAKCGNTGVLGKRTLGSGDDIWLDPNKENKITYESDAAIGITLKARGIWR